MMKTLTLASAMTVMMATGAVADIDVVNPYVRIVYDNANVASAYATVYNTGDTDDKLVGVETSAVGKAELHRTVVSDEGIASMESIPEIPLMAGKKAELKPGHNHIMLFQMKDPVVSGDEMFITMQFKNAPEQNVKFKVKLMGEEASSKMKHDESHDHNHDESHDHDH